MRIDELVEDAVEDIIEDKERDEREEAIDREVFDFCIRSLKQQVAFKIYVNPLLYFAAVLGIDARKRGWKPAKDYTAQLAELVWYGRMLMLEHIFEDQPDDPEQVQVEMVDRFRDEYRRWLADGSHTPFSTIMRWMLYSKGFRTKEGGTAKVL